MAGKLAMLVVLFSLVLSSVAFASMADHQDRSGEAGAGAGAGEVAGDRDQALEEAEIPFVLYLGPLNEIVIQTPARERVD